MDSHCASAIHEACAYLILRERSPPFVCLWTAVGSVQKKTNNHKQIIIAVMHNIETNTGNNLKTSHASIGQSLEKAWGNATPGLREPLEGVTGEVSERAKGEDTELPSSSLTKNSASIWRTICSWLFLKTCFWITDLFKVSFQLSFLKINNKA